MPGAGGADRRPPDERGGESSPRLRRSTGERGPPAQIIDEEILTRLLEWHLVRSGPEGPLTEGASWSRLRPAKADANRGLRDQRGGIFGGMSRKGLAPYRAESAH